MFLDTCTPGIYFCRRTCMCFGWQMYVSRVFQTTLDRNTSIYNSIRFRIQGSGPPNGVGACTPMVCITCACTLAALVHGARARARNTPTERAQPQGGGAGHTHTHTRHTRHTHICHARCAHVPHSPRTRSTHTARAQPLHMGGGGNATINRESLNQIYLYTRTSYCLQPRQGQLLGLM